MNTSTHVLEFHRDDAIHMLLYCANPTTYTAFDPHEACYGIGRMLYRFAQLSGWALETGDQGASDSEQSA